MTRREEREARDPSYRERLIEKASRWIDAHVPVHTRAEYQHLFVTNTDLRLKLFCLSVDHAELRKAYYQLQKDAVRGIPLPKVRK